METTTLSRVDETYATVTSRVARVRLLTPSAVAAAPGRGTALSGVGMHRVQGDVQAQAWTVGRSDRHCGIDATDTFSTRLGPPLCSPV